MAQSLPTSWTVPFFPCDVACLHAQKISIYIAVLPLCTRVNSWVQLCKTLLWKQYLPPPPPPLALELASLCLSDGRNRSSRMMFARAPPMVPIILALATWHGPESAQISTAAPRLLALPPSTSPPPSLSAPLLPPSMPLTPDRVCFVGIPVGVYSSVAGFRSGERFRGFNVESRSTIRGGDVSSTRGWWCSVKRESR